MRTAALTALMLTACHDPNADTLARARDAVAHADGQPVLQPGDIISAYKANPVNADRAYLAHAVRFRAVVDRIVQAKDGNAVVMLRDNDEHAGEFACWWDAPSGVAEFEKGSMIVARGYGAGMSSGEPTFIACVLERKEW